jgi:hypothetical protein
MNRWQRALCHGNSWRYCFATLTIVAAILYPDMFGAPFEQF